MSDPVVCPVCEKRLPNPPARLDLPSGRVNVLVCPGACEKKGLTPAQIKAIEAAQK